MPDQDTEPTDVDIQMSVGPITDAFHRHDLAMLAQLTPEERAVQAKLRRDLYKHINRIWEEPERTIGKHPVDIGGYGSVAALRDLLDILCLHVAEAQDAAGDVSEQYHVTVNVEMID